MRVVAVHVNVGGEFTGIHNILGDASRNAEGTSVGWHHRAGGDDGAGPHERLGADPHSVEEHGPGSDERVVLHAASLQVSVVPDHAAVSDDRVLRVGAVHDRAVLNGRLGSHDDGAVIAAQYGSRPYRGFGSHTDIADDDGVRVDESRGVNIGGFVPECVESHGSIVTL